VPELPFLEILAENLAAAVAGRRIEAIEIRQPALLRSSAAPAASFRGEFLSHPSRVGKYIVLETESRRAIVLHLMRLGRLTVVTPKQPGPAAPKRGKSAGVPARGVLPKNVSARIVFDDGSELRLIEHGTEKRARLWLVDDLDTVEELREIGPDPTRDGLTREAFAAAARATPRQLKSFLTDQRAISGIGNGLADEILYEARLSPLQRTGNLTEEEAGRLFAAVGSVLRRQVALLRESAGASLPQKEPVEHYVVHDHKGDPCPRCGGKIAWISYAERDTFYCPGCQTGGVPLKDRRLSRLLK
jgi:formamidopyrimidine-DNA glycosylase